MKDTFAHTHTHTHTHTQSPHSGTGGVQKLSAICGEDAKEHLASASRALAASNTEKEQRGIMTISSPLRPRKKDAPSPVVVSSGGAEAAGGGGGGGGAGGAYHNVTHKYVPKTSSVKIPSLALGASTRSPPQRRGGTAKPGSVSVGGDMGDLPLPLSHGGTEGEGAWRRTRGGQTGSSTAQTFHKPQGGWGGGYETQAWQELQYQKSLNHSVKRPSA